ncbi:MAG: FAD-dependent oxidoreductase [DPANN group archaeon]|nr:FAD-dependent oxidoreductase [DPANN group archaeon]
MEKYELVIVGGGVTGTAELDLAARFTGIKSMALLESRLNPGEENSAVWMNANTLHRGWETQHAYSQVSMDSHSADMIVAYARHYGLDKGLDKIINEFPKMLLAVGEKEIQKLYERYGQMRGLFPGLELLDAEGIARVEPNVMRGRNPKQKVAAIYRRQNEYAVDYGKLAQHFVETAAKEGQAEGKTVNVYTGTKVLGITLQENGTYRIKTSNPQHPDIETRALMISAGAHSLFLAKQMGHCQYLSVTPIAGDFYRTPKGLNGKVYTIQNPNIPFAAIHGDPDLEETDKTRWGPTARFVPRLDKFDKSTAKAWRKSFGGPGAVASLADILTDFEKTAFMAKNFLYQLPFGLDKYTFARSIRKVIPSTKVEDITRAEGVGGIRPQIIDTRAPHGKKLLLGEAKVIIDGGEEVLIRAHEGRPAKGKLIVNMTPSPGATMCEGNAEFDIRHIAKELGVPFYQDKFEQFYRLKKTEAIVA